MGSDLPRLMGSKMDETLINVVYETTDPFASVVQNLRFALESGAQPNDAKFRVVIRIDRLEPPYLIADGAS
jgi:hypothetical protein